MKERLLVLAKAAPIVSARYQHLVCVAGITDKGEWRRVYPIPLNFFWEGGGFKKKYWIEYELQSETPSDHRPESRKIIPETITQLWEERYSEVHKLLEQRLTSLEDLIDKGHRQVSLGVVKPNISDFNDRPNEHYEQMIEKSKQQNLFGTSAVKVFIPEKQFSYTFNCCPSCSKNHDLLCEDWELAELYRGCELYKKTGKYPDEETVIAKVRERMFNWMKTHKELYFIVGTHFLFNSYMIVGIVYPRKADVF